MNLPDLVSVLIVHPSQRKILCIKRSKTDETFPDMWGLPGGGRNKNESVEDALKRELFEETGAKLDQVDRTPFIESTLTLKQHVFTINVYIGKITFQEVFEPHDSDIQTAQWIAPELLFESVKQSHYPPDQVFILEQKLKELFT